MTEKTLRDEIAIAALQSLIRIEYGKEEGAAGITSASEIAYKFADAMLAQRGKG